MTILKFSVTILFLGFTCATHFRYDDPNTWNTSLPENLLNYLDSVDKIDPSLFLRNTSVLNDKQCNEDLLSIIHDLRANYQWPKMMLDAGNLGPYSHFRGNRIQIGNYDECLSVNPPNRNFTGKFCLVHFNDTNDPIDFLAIGYFWFRRPLMLYGICIPSTCSAQYLDKILKELWSPMNNKSLSDYIDVGVDEENCHTRTESKNWKTETRVAICVVIIIGSCMALSSIYDVWCEHVTKNEKPSKLWLAFSVPRNLSKIFDTSHTDRIASMSAIKAIVALLIVNFHCTYLSLSANIMDTKFLYAASNGSEPGSLWTNEGSTTVDAFFVISGALMASSFLSEVKKRSKYDPGMAYVKRYIRLMLPVAFLMIMKTGLYEIISGPISHTFNKFLAGGCFDKLWSVPLLCSNLVLDPRKSCLQHVWYIYVDLQLAFASQFIFIYGLWHPKRCAPIAGILCCAGTIVEFFIASIFDIGLPIAIDRGNLWLEDYTMPHTRCTPWFAGLFLGFLLEDILKRKPTKVQATIGWLLCVVCIFLSLYPYQFFSRDEYTQPWTAMYLSLHRVTWSLGVGLVIILCETGCGGYVTELCSWAPLKFIEKISFELYLVHFVFIEITMLSSKESFYYSLQRGFYMYFSVLPISIALAIVLAVMITLPCNTILAHFQRDWKICPMRAHWNEEKVLEEVETCCEKPPVGI